MTSAKCSDFLVFSDKDENEWTLYIIGRKNDCSHIPAFAVNKSCDKMGCRGTKIHLSLSFFNHKMRSNRDYIMHEACMPIYGMSR